MEELEKQRQVLLDLEKKSTRRLRIVVIISITLLTILFCAYLWKSYNFSWDYIKHISRYNPLDSRLVVFTVYLPAILIGDAILIGLSLTAHVGVQEEHEEFKKYLKMYKNYIVTDCLKELFDDVEVDYDKGIPEETVSDSGAIEVRSIFESEDYHKGKYKDIGFECSDVLIEHWEKSGEDNKLVIDFYGQWYIFDFNKKVKGKVRITRKEHEDYKEPDYVELEDEDFNKVYSVFAEDKHLAFYILTPNFMEKIKQLEKDLDADLCIAIVNNKIHIGVDNLFTNLFLIDYKNPIDAKLAKEQIKKEVNVVIQIIDTLDLDNDLFKQ